VRGSGFNKSANTPDALLQLIVLQIVDGVMHHPKRGEAEAEEGGREDQRVPECEPNSKRKMRCD
jgi:hypothetical protein